MNNYQMFRKIQEQAKVYEEYDNFDREDLIDELEKWLIIKTNDNYKYTEYDEVLNKLNELKEK